MSKKYLLMMFVLLSAILLAACANNSIANVPASSPDQVVEQFYSWYLGDREMGPKDLRDSELLSQTYFKKLEESSGPGMGSTMVCAQDFPDQVMVEETETDGNHGRVMVKTSFGNHIAIDLQLENNQWLIIAATCQP